MVISALHLSMKIKKNSHSSWGLHFNFFVFCVLSFVSLLHCCFVICIVTFFFPFLLLFCHLLFCFLLVTSCKLWCCSCLLSPSFQFISLHFYFCSSRLALAFIHLVTFLLIFILLHFVVSCLVFICFIAPLFIFLHSCFYKVIKNDIMCPFCIGRQLTSIQMCQFHSSSQTLAFCFDGDSFFGQVLAINSFLIISCFDHQVKHLKKIGHRLNKNFNLCLENFQLPPIKFQLSN